MVAIEIPSDYGYVVLVTVAFWIQQSIIFVVPIGLQRYKTGIKPPVIYPSDSLVKSLNLTDSQVNQYMCAQRVHQNNMEFLVVFFPMLLIAGLYNPLHTAAAGVVVWLGRLITALGYWSAAEKRMYGGWYHIPEFYIIYLVVRFGIQLIHS